ncbi:MAG: acyl-CoA thioesterase [Marinagarivorans sp.]|nr:acyl-CoA thioesterase [Marinagarivorans sp.]
MDFIFTLEFKVRDYECDLQGIVNNSVYQNYFEHARHEFFLSRGISFAALSTSGINLVVTRAEVHYKAPLKSGDVFTVGLNHCALSKIRGQFTQIIFQQDWKKPRAVGSFDYAAINTANKPVKLDEIFKKITPEY